MNFIHLTIAHLTPKFEAQHKRRSRIESNKLAKTCFPGFVDHSCGNFDFEKGTLEGWIAHGAAFSHQPTLGDNIRARTSGYNKTSSGHQGSWWIGTYENRSKADIPAGEVQGNTPTGGLVSSLIRITGPDANFLLGGGCGSKTVVYLMLDGIPRQFNDKIKCKEQMVRVTSRVFKDFIGRVGRIVLLDFDEGGHLNFDDFRGDFVCLGKTENKM